MNILLDRLPEEAVIDEVSYPINSDFRVMILFDEIMHDPELTDEERLVMPLQLFYKESTPPDLQVAVDFLLWFYRVGKDLPKSNDEDKDLVKKPARIYSYEHDAAYIYAAFLDQYDIDLNEEKLHWFKFRALLDSLREDHKFSKILGYRSMTISSDLSPKQKKHYQEMKLLYALPDERTEEEKEQDFAESFGDLF